MVEPGFEPAVLFGGQALSLSANRELVCFILCDVSSAQGKVCLQDKGIWTQVSKTQRESQRPNPRKQRQVEEANLCHLGNILLPSASEVICMQCGAATPHKRTTVCYKLRPKAQGLSLSRLAWGPGRQPAGRHVVLSPGLQQTESGDRALGLYWPAEHLTGTTGAKCVPHVCPELCQSVLGPRPATCRALGPLGY